MKIPAGSLADWLTSTQEALTGTRDAEVPCGSCTACCRASQFVHVGPDEADTLAHIPRGLTFPAPLMPPGHVVMGYDEQGRCPMLVDDRCSIYEHRPRTCRTYDCRVFAATGIDVGEGGRESTKAGIADRASNWSFDLGSDADRAAQDALRAASARLEDPRHGPSAEPVPTAPTQRAVWIISKARPRRAPIVG